MTTADLPLGMRLKEQAGWNQLEADWRRFLDMEPGGAFVAELDGVDVGTAAVMIFGPVAWVALVLVDSASRRRGVGQALMEHAITQLIDRGVRTIRLDATPLGQPLYEKLGFVQEYLLTRFVGPAPAAPASEDVQELRPEHLDALLRLDLAVTQTERSKVLLRLFAQYPGAIHVALRGGAVEGYVACRPGSRALHIGPCIASADAGPRLLADAWRRHAGQAVF